MGDESKVEQANPANQEVGETRPTGARLFGGAVKETAPEHADEVVDKPAEAGLGRQSVEPVSTEQPFDVEAAEAANLVGDDREDDKSVSYAAPGVPNFRIGPYQFERGVLNLTPEDAEKFDNLIGQCSPQIQHAVYKVDAEAGERVARRLKALNEGRMVQGGETSGHAPQAPNPAEQKHLI
jgi:hypothetical protein